MRAMRIVVLLLATMAAMLFARGMGSVVRPASRRAPKAVQALKPRAMEFRDVAAGMGLTVANRYGGVLRKRTIFEMTGNRVAIVDFDNDGHPDIFLSDGKTPLLYRKRRNWTFENMTPR